MKALSRIVSSSIRGALMHDLNSLFKPSDFPFVDRYPSLADIMTDRDLAALGDAFVNFVYSLALSFRKGKPIGSKLDNSTLASALRESGLRKILPSRIDRHRQANAAEALIVYAWISGLLSLKEMLRILNSSERLEDSWKILLQRIAEGIKIS